MPFLEFPPQMNTLIHSSNDDLVFLDEPVTDVSQIKSAQRNTWRIMIIDDDHDVHSATTFALGSLDIQNKGLSFLHAYSAEEARTILAKETDIAIILLDVVMEQEDAGLQLVNYIRKTLNLTDVRIILRTGQPGYAPEIDAIRDYDINDYKTKSELTRTKLVPSRPVVAALNSSLMPATNSWHCKACKISPSEPYNRLLAYMVSAQKDSSADKLALQIH
jgi:CheY-like chemotaxis protein